MVKIKIVKDCKISFMQDGESKKFEFKKDEVIDLKDDVIVKKLLYTRLGKKIK